MISTIYWINEKKLPKECIGIMPRPRGNDWLIDEIKALKNQKIDYLISLLEFSEVLELGLEEEKNICQQLNITYLNFPIKDVRVPDCEDKFIALTETLANYIRNNKKVVIHCRMGIGRSSMLAAAIMLLFGYKGNGVFKIIEHHRKLAVPDTNAQRDWILKIEEKLTLIIKKASKQPPTK